MKPIALLSLLSVVACSSDEGVKVYNSDPTATITSHSDGSEFMEAVEYTFVGQVSDDNDSNTDLKVVWSSDTRELCPESIPDATGATACRVALETSDTQIKLLVTDPEGAAGVSSIGVDVVETDAPTIEMISPVVDGAYYSDQLIQFSAIINDTEDEPADLQYTWASSLDGDLSLSAPPSSDGTISGYLNLSEGQHAITLRVEDTSGKSTAADLAITVGGVNNEPLCVITAPEEGSAYIIGQNISFSGSATDEDINNSLLSISWESNVDGVFDTTSANTAGELGFSYADLSAGNHTITLKIEDEVDGLCTDTVQLAVGTAPILTLTSPIDGDLYSVGDSVSFAASVEDQEDVASDIALSWTSDIDGDFSTQGANSNGNISFNTSALSAGLHNIGVVATDSTGLTDSTALTIRVNTPPTAPTVGITPDPAITNDGLVATASDSTDADGDNISYSYSWTQNGNATSYNSSSVPSSATLAGEVWTVRATPNDGYTDGNYTEATITISNSAPSISSVGISPSSANNDDVLTCSAIATDADETLTPIYTWMVGSVGYSGASLDLSTTAAMPDDVVTCSAEVTDSAGESASSSASLTVDNRNPVVSGTSLDLSMVYTNSVVACSASVSDDDGESLTVSYEWFAGTTSIGSGDSISLDNTLVSVGDTLMCTASSSDGYGGSASEDATVTILNTEPVVDSVEIDLSTPVATDVLTCSASGSDIDGDTPTYSFSWSNLTTGDVYTSSTTDTDSATLDLSTTAVAVSDEVECVVVASDADGGSDSDVAVVTIYNSGPQFDTAASIDISPDVYVGDVLTCSASASDLNDGSVTPTYEWSVNGSVFASGASYTVDATNTDFGDDLVCTATATDSDNETAISEATVTVQNTAPTVSNVVVVSDSGNNYNDDTLTCTADVADVDENINNTQYIWSMGTTQIGTGSTLDLSTVSVMPNDEIVCTVQTMDDNFTAAEDTGSLTLANRNPVLGTASIDNSTPYADSTMVCSASVTDADGETLSASFEWTNGTTVLGSSATLTLTPSDASVGDTITCTASVSDGYGGSDSTTATATIQNTDPTMSAVSVSPSSPSITDTLTCSATGTDLNDGALTAVVYSWTNSTTGDTLGSASTLALDASTSGPTDTIVCTVAYTDNNTASVSDSASVTISNTPPPAPNASITPDPATTTDDLTVNATENPDADGDSQTFIYQWFKNGLGTTYASQSIPSSETTKGDVWMVRVYADDGTDQSTATEVSITISNTAPSVSSVVITGGTYNDDTLTCSATASDVDESVTVAYTWSIDSVDVGTGASIDLGTTAALPTDDVICTALVEDSDGGSASDTATLTLVNRLPSTPTVSISPTAPTAATDDLVCNITTASTDADGQTVSYTYEWTKDSVATSDTTNTISASDVGASETWMCTVTPDDGMDFGGSASDSVTSASACVLTDCDSSLDLGGGYGVDFVNITAGTFMMGSPSSEVGRGSNEDQHSVTLSNDFLVSTTEITQGMYNQLMGYQAYDGKNSNYGVGSDYPVYYVSWNMAADFSNQLTQQHNSLNGTSLEECYSCSSSGSTSVSCSTAVTPIYSCTGYRLLTEAEWEYAARAGTTAAIWTSNGGGNIPSGYEYSGGCNLNWTLSDGTTLGDLGWFCGNNQWSNSSYPLGSKEVATKTANDNGLYDMSGNLWEWTHDTYTGSLGTGATTDPVREIDSYRVFRGGYWNAGPSSLRSARRYYDSPANRYDYFGFRTGRTYTSIP